MSWSPQCRPRSEWSPEDRSEYAAYIEEGRRDAEAAALLERSQERTVFRDEVPATPLEVVSTYFPATHLDDEYIEVIVTRGGIQVLEYLASRGQGCEFRLHSITPEEQRRINDSVLLAWYRIIHEGAA